MLVIRIRQLVGEAPAHVGLSVKTSEPVSVRERRNGKSFLQRGKTPEIRGGIVARPNARLAYCVPRCLHATCTYGVRYACSFLPCGLPASLPPCLACSPPELHDLNAPSLSPCRCGESTPSRIAQPPVEEGTTEGLRSYVLARLPLQATSTKCSSAAAFFISFFSGRICPTKTTT